MLTFSASHPASPSVFISSTVNEFRDLRSALAYMLRAQGFTVRLSEAADFDVRGDRSAFEECFSNIRASDYYVLIIGGKRGNLYQDGTSITRQEYRVARHHFLSSSRPIMHFYLREDIELAINGSRRAQKKVGIDDLDHLISFIDEVQNPGIEGTPSYVKRFSDFEDVIKSVTNWLNLGRTISETLIRHSLLSDLAFNLSKMVSNIGGSPFPYHWCMTKMRNETSITPQVLGQTIVLSDDQVISLVLALVGRTRGNNLRTKAIEESLNQGVFLTFNPAKAILEESQIYKALQQTCEDIQELCLLDSPSAFPGWDSELLTDIKTRWKGRPHSLEVNSYYLASTLSHYDRITNIFNGHVALCKVLLGMTEELESYKRQPVTPLGEQEEQKIHAERVSVAEVTLLIQNNVWPFGTRVPRDVYGKTRDEQILKIAAIMSKTLREAGVDPDRFQEVLKRAAKEYVEKYTA